MTGITAQTSGRLRARMVWGALVAGVCAGCGSVSTAPLSAMQACADMAQALCAKRASCTNGAGIARTNGDMDSCVSEEQQLCTLALTAPDTTGTPSGTELCVAAYATLSCTDFLDGNQPAACARVGTRANDAPCTFNGQCASAFCARNKNSVCGVCATPPSVGDSCVDSNCGRAQTCLASTNTCQAYIGAGQPCDAATCSAGLNCVGANSIINMGTGTCMAAATTAGDACGAGTAGCAGVLGLSCGGTAGNKTCMMVTFAAEGAPCGQGGDGTRAFCLAGGCYTSDGIAGESDSGTCKADVAAGVACDVMIGPLCKPPGRCVVAAGATSGTCTIPDPSVCH